MKLRRLLLALLAILFFVLPALGWLYIDLADVPPELRTPNWPARDDGSGSCVNASTVTCLRWLGLEADAERWKSRHEGGETMSSHIRHMEASGLRFSYITADDQNHVEWLEWATRNRLCVGMFYGDWHAQNLIELNDTYAVVLDNNDIHNPYIVPRDRFLSEWRRVGGFAWVFIYTPPPPWPVQL